jgi:hypothetical protein
MLKDLESMHEALLAAWKAVNLLQGVDLDALVVQMKAAERTSNEDVEGEDEPIVHLPI